MEFAPDEELEELVLRILRAHPDGIGEFEVVRALRAAGRREFGRFANRLALFRAHFVLFHVLYRLRERLWLDRQGHLEISALSIRLLPYEEQWSAPPEALGRNDPLRDYYMDLSNLESTTAEDVQTLLDSFWRRFEAGAGDPERKREALAVLELSEPVDYETIKRQYRRLTMAHHPDRGGDGETLQRINAAMSVLEAEYGK